MEYINRHLEDRILELSKSYSAILLTGPRQAGKTTMLQTEAGYNTCSGKRIEIAEHLRYLPMGFFNANSLGRITNITTNTMEQAVERCGGKHGNKGDECAITAIKMIDFHNKLS